MGILIPSLCFVGGAYGGRSFSDSRTAKPKAGAVWEECRSSTIPLPQNKLRLERALPDYYGRSVAALECGTRNDESFPSIGSPDTESGASPLRVGQVIRR